MKKAAPVIAKLRRLQYEYTKDIDMADVNKAKARINELEVAKNQLTNQIGASVSDEEKTGITSKINELEAKLEAAKKALETNSSFAHKIKVYNECSALAVLELFSDSELIRPAVESLVDGDIDIDFNESGTLKFLTEVFTDFFLLIKTGKMKSQI